MTTTPSLLRRLLAGVALVVVVALSLADVAGADEPAPAYPPSPGGDEVVEAGDGPGATEPAGAGDVDEPATDADAEGDGATEGDEPDDGAEESAAAATGDGAPGDDDRGAARALVLVGTALLLGGGVVAIARRI